MNRGSIGGITISNAWMRNNPELQYPEGHEEMDDATLSRALQADHPAQTTFNNKE